MKSNFNHTILHFVPIMGQFLIPIKIGSFKNNTRFFSSTNNNKPVISALVTYSNCELEKSRILTDNKNKAVIYR